MMKAPWHRGKVEDEAPGPEEHGADGDAEHVGAEGEDGRENQAHDDADDCGW